MKTRKFLVTLLSFMMFAVAYAAQPDGKIEYLSDKTFSEKVYEIKGEKLKFKGNKAVVLDYTASWCPPCKKLSPIYQELADEYKGKVDFYKIDVDENPELMTIFKVSSMPTLIYISADGKSYTKSIGFEGKEPIKKQINEILKK